MYVCMDGVWMDGWMDACMHACMHACIYIYIYLFTFIFTYVYDYICTYVLDMLEVHLAFGGSSQKLRRGRRGVDSQLHCSMSMDSWYGPLDLPRPVGGSKK